MMQEHEPTAAKRAVQANDNGTGDLSQSSLSQDHSLFGRFFHKKPTSTNQTNQDQGRSYDMNTRSPTKVKPEDQHHRLINTEELTAQDRAAEERNRNFLQNIQTQKANIEIKRQQREITSQRRADQEAFLKVKQKLEAELKAANKAISRLEENLRKAETKLSETQQQHNFVITQRGQLIKERDRYRSERNQAILQLVEQTRQDERIVQADKNQQQNYLAPKTIKSYKENYEDTITLLFGEPEAKTKSEIADLKDRIFEDKQLDLSKYNDDELMVEIRKYHKDAIKTHLKKLSHTILENGTSESVTNQLPIEEVIIAIAFGDKIKDFKRWKEENPKKNTWSAFTGKLKKGSVEDKIRSRAVANLYQSINDHGVLFGVEQSELQPKKLDNNNQEGKEDDSVLLKNIRDLKKKNMLARNTSEQSNITLDTTIKRSQ